MKSKIIAIVSLLLVVGGFAIYWSFHSKNTNEVKNNANTTSGVNTEKQIVKNNPDLEAINDAGMTWNEDSCESISDADKKAECIDNAFAAKAWLQKDRKYCESIKESKFRLRCLDSFLYEDALSSKKKEDCLKINNPEYKKACEKNIIFTLIESKWYNWWNEVCNSLSWADKEYCISRISKWSDVETFQNATSTKNINDCSKISDITLKNSCSDVINLNQAISTKNLSMCNLIIDTTKKTSCTQALSKIQDSSLLQNAVQSGNISLCANITTKDIKDKCSDTINLKLAITTKNKSMCDMIIDVSMKKQCQTTIETYLNALNK